MTVLENNNIDAKGSTNEVKASSSVAKIGGKFYAKNSSSKYDDTSWIVDKGATYHTCYDINWLKGRKSTSLFLLVCKICYWIGLIDHMYS